MAKPGTSRRVLRRVGWAALALLGLVVATGAWLWHGLPDVAPLGRTPPATTAFIELRRAEAAAAGRPFELRWTWVRLERVSRYLRFAVVAAEDARFFEHDGIDWDALEAAARRDLRERRLSAGGSTITQQLAKNLYLSPSKNPLRKLREGLIARRLEAELGKPRILELYLNIAEWGDGVFGAEAAAQHHFGRSAAALSPAQAARLAVALPNPHRRSPTVASARLDRKAARLLEAMRWRGLIDEAGYRAALAELGAARRRATARR